MRQRRSGYFSWGGLALIFAVLVLISIWPLFTNTFRNEKLAEQPSLSVAWDSTAPSFDIWYGKNQKFGNSGITQSDFNLLGHAYHPEGIKSLTYSVNGKMGGQLNFNHYRRLERFGDFNAEIPISDLKNGKNFVVLTIKDKLDRIIRDTVWVRRIFSQIQQTRTIHWQNVTNLQDVGQVSDGKWEITKDGLQIIEPGYDRIFLIGDKSWQDYQVMVPVKIIGLDQNYTPYDKGSSFGIVMRFGGHTAGGYWKFPQAQPKWGYLPVGAIGFVTLNSKYADLNIFRSGKPNDIDFSHFYIDHKTQYLIKMSCQTIRDDSTQSMNTLYSFKIWKYGDTEPTSWDWQYMEKNKLSLQRGGIGLLANHIKMVFGDVQITHINSQQLISLE